MLGSILFFLSLGSAALGFFVFVSAAGAIHQILGAIGMLIAAVFLSCAFIVDRLDRVMDAIKKRD